MKKILLFALLFSVLAIGVIHAQYAHTVSYGSYDLQFVYSPSSHTCYVTHGTNSSRMPRGSVSIPSSIHISGANIDVQHWGTYRVTSIHSMGGGSITSISIPSSVTTIGGWAFAGCTSLRTIHLPNSVTSVGNYAFSGCTALSSVTFSLNLSTISDGMFQGCTGLNSVTIPATISAIGNNAFKDCTGITDITCASSNPAVVGTNSFQSVPLSTPIYIPCGSWSSYNVRWTYFSNFIEASSNTFTAVSADDNMGTVDILLQPSCTQIMAVFQAIPNEYYHFVQWSDSNTDNPRVLSVTQNTSLVASFALGSQCDTVYQILHDTAIVTLHDTTYIPIHDTAYVPVHDTMFITNHIHDTTYVTVHDTTYVILHDTIYINNYIHDTTIVDHIIHDTIFVNHIIHDTTYVTLFDTTYVNNYIHDTLLRDIDYYYLTLSSVPQIGITVGSGLYADSTVVEIAAIPLRGNHFVQWNDGSTENPRHILMRCHIYLSAMFEVDNVGVTDVEALTTVIGVENNVILVQGAIGKRIRIFDEVGRLLSSQEDMPDNHYFRMPSTGVYFVQVGDGPAQRVVVR